MAKVTLNDLASLTANENSTIARINDNMDAIATAIENTLSRDGTTPNTMGADLDMNSNDVLNVGTLYANTIVATNGDATTLNADNLTFASIAALRAYTTTDVITDGSTCRTASYHSGLRKGGGIYVYVSSDTTTADDGGKVLVDGDGRRWYLLHGGSIFLSQCGGRIDGSTDDLAAFNLGLSYLNDNNSGINVLRLDSGTFYTSAKPNACIRSDNAIVGEGVGATTWSMNPTEGTFLQLGQDVSGTFTTATRWTISGIRFIYNGTCSSSNPAIHFLSASFCTMRDCIINSTISGLMLGYPTADSTGYAAGNTGSTQCVFYNNYWTILASNGGYAVKVTYATGTFFIGNSWTGAGKNIPNSRGLILAPTNAEFGIDGLLFSNCKWNFNAADMDYLVEVDATYPAVSNTRITGCTVDGGSARSFRFKIGSASTSPNAAVWNFSVTGCRITAATRHPSGGGGSVRVDQEVDSSIHGVNFTGNVFFNGCNYPFYEHNRSGGATTDKSAFTFVGNTIAITPCYTFADYASTANISLLEGLQNIDGGTGARNQIILAKDQSTQAKNGLWRMKGQATISNIVKVTSTSCRATYVNGGGFTNDFTVGGTIYFDSVTGMTEVNTNRYTITAVDTGALTVTFTTPDNTTWGAYISGGTGTASWVRYAKFDDWNNDIAGCVVGVRSGSTYANTLWECTSALGGTLESTSITFTSFNPYRNLLEINSNDFTFVGNTITYGADDDDLDANESIYSELVGWPYLNYLMAFKASTLKRVVCLGNTVKSSVNIIDVKTDTLNSGSLIDGPQVGYNAGMTKAPIRQVQTTDATTTVIGQFDVTNGYTYRISGKIIGTQSDDSNRACYSFNALASGAAGTATIAWNSVTVDYESDAAWNADINASSASIRIRVTGKAATTINWSLHDLKIEVQN